MRVLHEVLQVKQDFTAFHVGCHRDRPGTQTGVPGLFCAGDWVKLPFPAMLLEAACASGIVAANHILQMDGLREEPVLSVPLRGLMAGIPEPPGRKVLLPP
jgi:isorenieratene synthase